MQTVMPDGLVFMGDSVASVNPKYGQGMTVAVLEALELKKCLQERMLLNERKSAGLAQVRHCMNLDDSCWGLTNQTH